MASALDHNPAHGADVGHKRLVSQERLDLRHDLFNGKDRHGNQYGICSLNARFKRIGRRIGNTHFHCFARTLSRQVKRRHRLENTAALHGPSCRSADQTHANQGQTHC